MVVKQTIIKVSIILIVIAAGLFVYKGYFPSPVTQSFPQTSPISHQPVSPISLAPKDRKTGWTTDEENQILALCPLPSFASAICSCVLTKVEQKYTFTQTQQMYAKYQQNNTIDPRLQEIIGACR